MGGNWEEYAEIVVGMVTADTLLAIEMLLTQILQQLRDGSASPIS
jgi:hypothetical protein